ncbi:hypothetical protein AVEN_207273-1 [Araneus ventricosus]|uniref:Uncharacterized protein n=1 Tax=Araneus ventricosus TaxID=182803 RepID=A0A4Y2IDL3_ARAVE|nr:hypothetical protein AVEN_207273-1 [Araneus ventricosus]
MKSGFESGTFDVRFNMYLAQHRRISDEIGFQKLEPSTSDLTCPGSTWGSLINRVSNLEPSTSIFNMLPGSTQDGSLMKSEPSLEFACTHPIRRISDEMVSNLEPSTSNLT